MATDDGADSGEATMHQRVGAINERAAAMDARNRELLTLLETTRRSEDAKRRFVTQVAYPEATAALSDPRWGGAGQQGGSTSDVLVQAALRGTGASALTVAQDLNRAHYMAVLNPLVQQLERLSDEFAAADPAVCGSIGLHPGAKYAS